MQPFCARARPRAAPARRTLLTHRASATRPPSRSGPCRAALVRSSPSPRTTARDKAAGDERTPDAAGTGARARCAHGSQRARVALTFSCGSPSASGVGSRPTGGACALRARARPQRSLRLCVRGRRGPGVAVRAGSREALSAPRVVARGRPQPIEAAQGAAASASRERHTPTFDRPWHGSLESYKSSAHGNRRMR